MVLRELMSPFTHGTFSAIIGAAIWRARGSGGWRGPVGVLGAFVCSVVLHALWDAYPQNVMALPWLCGVGAAGLLTLRQLFRHSLREQAFSILALNPRLAEAKTMRPGTPCHVCGQLGVPGAHYCARCGAILKGTPVKA